VSLTKEPDKPVICKVRGFCVAASTDMALCSELLVMADDARIGYPPARVWGLPISALVNQALFAQGLQATQALGVFFDGIARHTPEGHEFARRAAEAGFKQAVRERDEPYDG
jgi:hypothetical protein